MDNNDGLCAGRIKLFGNSSGNGGGGFALGSNSFGLILGSIAQNAGISTYIANAYIDGSGNQRLVSWYDANVSLGSSSYRWTSVWSTNGVIQTSDERDKQNIQSLKYGISSVMSLNPVSFEWEKEKSRLGTGTNLGFIAQELEKVIPAAVIHSTASSEEIESAAKAGRGTIEADTYGVKYSEIIPVLTKAIQEQQAQIEELKKEVQALKNK